MGLGIGISAVVVPVYLGEVAPAQVTAQTIHMHVNPCSALARGLVILHDITELSGLCTPLLPKCLLTASINIYITYKWTKSFVSAC